MDMDGFWFAVLTELDNNLWEKNHVGMSLLQQCYSITSRICRGLLQHVDKESQNPLHGHIPPEVTEKVFVNSHLALYVSTDEADPLNLQ